MQNLQVLLFGLANTQQQQGGTTGIGAEIAKDLAKRGAQLVLLVRQPLNDPFLQDFIIDLREFSGNELITAEQVDLASLFSIRKFATKWVDNAPPRRLDLIILCAATIVPKGSQVRVSDDGVESIFAINYLANFHLLSILSPAIRAQPPDRDVRVLLATCSSYMGGTIPDQVPRPKLPSSHKQAKTFVATNPTQAYGSSKLALMTFGQAFQKHLDAYQRPDKYPMNARVVLIDPGFTRTAGTRRFLTGGSLLGLLAYLLTWPTWWLFLKSANYGAQSFLHTAMEREYGEGQGGRFVKECKDVLSVLKPEVTDEAAQKKLWEMSEKAIEALEMEGARKRANDKRDEQEAAADAKRQEEEAKDAERKPGSRKSRKAA